MKNRGLVENGEVRRKTFSHDCFPWIGQATARMGAFRSKQRGFLE